MLTCIWTVISQAYSVLVSWPYFSILFKRQNKLKSKYKNWQTTSARTENKNSRKCWITSWCYEPFLPNWVCLSLTLDSTVCHNTSGSLNGYSCVKQNKLLWVWVGYVWEVWLEGSGYGSSEHVLYLCKSLVWFDGGAIPGSASTANGLPLGIIVGYRNDTWCRWL